MLLWISLSCGAALGVAMVVCALATVSAERRARRNLYASLGLGDDLIAVLMAQKGSVSTQLALVRQAAVSGGAVRLEDPRRAEGASAAPRRSGRFMRARGDGREAGNKPPGVAPTPRNPPPAGQDPA